MIIAFFVIIFVVSTLLEKEGNVEMAVLRAHLMEEYKEELRKKDQESP
mgnify:CR=1 FL=1